MNASERTEAAEAAYRSLEAARIELAGLKRSLGEPDGVFSAATLAKHLFGETLEAEKSAYGLLVACREAERDSAYAAAQSSRRPTENGWRPTENG